MTALLLAKELGRKKIFSIVISLSIMMGLIVSAGIISGAALSYLFNQI